MAWTRLSSGNPKTKWAQCLQRLSQLFPYGLKEGYDRSGWLKDSPSDVDGSVEVFHALTDYN